MHTPETYWNTLFGTRSASQVVAEFELVDDTDRGWSEWLGHCEAAATEQGATLDEVPASWRSDVIAELRAAAREDQP